MKFQSNEIIYAMNFVSFPAKLNNTEICLSAFINQNEDFFEI